MHVYHTAHSHAHLQSQRFDVSLLSRNLTNILWRLPTASVRGVFPLLSGSSITAPYVLKQWHRKHTHTLNYMTYESQASNKKIVS